MMEKTLVNTAKVSFHFFIVLGAMHITASMLVARGTVNMPDWVLFNALDLPFLLVALIYGSCKFALSVEHITGNYKIPMIVAGAVSALLFTAALYFNFVLPDAKIF